MKSDYINVCFLLLLSDLALVARQRSSVLKYMVSVLLALIIIIYVNQ